ncbi:hypothetical protein EVAR_5262_1 [Eumeta japonica]|uniref:Uncharacterized protein n=1 Tax=Eumeta variegata TaxID=151549 RepID=A0A4C1XMG2_EUMVA|nr:hypothetical protein EVAR_5262_1 [Eumeta japonica]
MHEKIDVIVPLRSMSRSASEARVVGSVRFVLHLSPLYSPTLLQHENLPVRSVKYRTFTEYGHELAASAVAFHLVSESSGGPLFSPPSISPIHPFIRYPIPSQEDGNAMVALCCDKPPSSFGGDDHLLSDSSPAHLSLEYAIKNPIQPDMEKFYGCSRIII